jgi:hypothetical protein
LEPINKTDKRIQKSAGDEMNNDKKIDIAICLCENNSATLSLCRCAEYMHSLNKL